MSGGDLRVHPAMGDIGENGYPIIKDWKGNIVKVGDVVKIINPKTWDESKEYTVFEEDGVLCHYKSTYNGFDFSIALSTEFVFFLSIRKDSCNKR